MSTASKSSFCGNDAVAGGGAYAYVGSSWTPCSFTDYRGFESSATMNGGIGTSPAYLNFFTLEAWAGQSQELDGSYTCFSTLFGPANGNLLFLSFPSNVEYIVNVTINLDTAFSVPEFSNRSTVTVPRGRAGLFVGSGNSPAFLVSRVGKDIFLPSGWSIVSQGGIDYPEGGVVNWGYQVQGPVSLVPSGSAPVAFNVRAVVVDDDTFDFNGDGRFDEADVSWLSAAIPSSNPELLARANLNDSGASEDVVDGADVAEIQALLDNNLGTPAFGDSDGDGCVTCSDAFHGLINVDAIFDGVLSSNALYSLALDSNADGVLDSGDRVAFYAAVNHADFTGDGTVDDADFTIFTGYYDLIFPPVAGTSGGDQNGDGICDDADFLIFASRYDDLVCPSCS
ncbi:MAG TPA: hypothetical protein VF777_10265 [Phycisphaerales bacterium]